MNTVIEAQTWNLNFYFSVLYKWNLTEKKVKQIPATNLVNMNYKVKRARQAQEFWNTYFVMQWS